MAYRGHTSPPGQQFRQVRSSRVEKAGFDDESRDVQWRENVSSGHQGDRGGTHANGVGLTLGSRCDVLTGQDRVTGIFVISAVYVGGCEGV